MPGILAALTAKLAGLTTVAKAAIAALTAALTMTVAGGATGVLPLPGAHDGVTAVSSEAVQQAVTALAAAASTATATATGSAPAVEVTGHANVASSATSTASSTSAKTAAATSNVTTSVPTTIATALTTTAAVSKVATAGLPDLSKLPPCLAALVPTAGTRPDLAKLFAELPACILSIVKAHLPLDAVPPAIGSAHLPVDVFKCLATALKAAPATAGTNLAGLRQLLAGCVPAGVLPSSGTATGAGSATGSGSHAGLKTGR